MRQLHITKTHADNTDEARRRTVQTEELLSLWTTLGATGLSAEAQVLYPVLEKNAHFVFALAKQYPHPMVSPEMLVTAAHQALVDLLNQYVLRPAKLDKVLVLTLRNAMAVAIQAPAGGAQ